LNKFIIVGNGSRYCFDENAQEICDASWKTYAGVYIYSTIFLVSFAFDAVNFFFYPTSFK